jgi:hypothetical protein
LPVHTPVTRLTQRDQIRFGIASGAAAEFRVVDLKVLLAAAVLASPLIALEDFEAQPVVSFGFEFDAGSLGTNWHHEPTLSTCSRKACRCERGRNLKTRATDCSNRSGLPLSSVAPARKSAQIISRQ